MRQTKLLLALIAVLSSALLLHSCQTDEYDHSTIFPNALVTLKTRPADGTFFLQLDDATVIIPTNIKTSPYGKKEVRALTNIKLTEDQKDLHTKSAFINWIDTIRTKEMAPNMGDKNITTYGNAPLEIVNDWATVVEDGYLTLRFRTYYGSGKLHKVNLVKTADPYEVTLFHDAVGDTRGVIRDGFIAFRLNDLPDTQGKTVDLTLKWKSFSGEKSVKFKYRTRK